MLRLRDIMTREIVSVSPDLSIRDAMTLFSERHIGGAPVIANNKLVGVVTLTDLVELASGMNGVPTERPDPVEWGEFEDTLAWVDDEETPVAFYTDMWDDSGADVTERIAATEGPEWNALEDYTVAEAMNRRIASLAPDTAVEDAAELMRRVGIHRVLVIESGQLVGIVSTKDVSDAVAAHRLTTTRFVFGHPHFGRALH
jgi:predicted transcriptional regulator